MERNTYVVTDKAGPHVAGRAVEHGEELQLTEHEAIAEELAGTIRRKEPRGEETPPPPEDPTSPAPVDPGEGDGDLQPAAGQLQPSDPEGSAAAAGGGHEANLSRNKRGSKRR